MIGDYAEGGLRIPDIRSQHEVLYCNWVKRLTNSEFAKWKIIPLYYLNHFGNGLLIFKMNFETSSLFPILKSKHISEFYKNVVECWHKSHTVYTQPTSVEDIKKEIIWGNKYIICDKFCLFIKHWIDSGIVYIYDICNSKGLLTPNSIKQKLTKKNNFLCEYKLILQSLPRRWKATLKTGGNRNVVIDNNSFCWNANWYSCQNIIKISSKIVYAFLVKNKITRCYCEQFWNSLFKQEINWSIIWLSQTKNLTDNAKMAEFNYKLLHQILPSGKLLKRWHLVNSDLCILCQSVDDYEHMFISCMHVKNLWPKIRNLVQKIFNLILDINFETIIIGDHSITKNDKLHRFINMVVTIAKYTIFKSWCKHRLDKNLFKNVNVFMYFQADLKRHLEVEICRKGCYINMFKQLINCI